MPVPLHSMHLYQKPKAGTQFIKRFPVFNYGHDINAIGGFDTAQFDIAIRSVDEGKQFLDQYLGNRVAIYADNPVEPIWEGFINRMTFSAGLIQWTISLDEMLNRVNVQYINTAVSTTVPQRPGVDNDTASQAIYGIKQGEIDMQIVEGAASTAAATLRDTILNQRAYPKSSIMRGQGNGLIHIECLGFYHTLDWEVYLNGGTATLSLTNNILTALNSFYSNGTTFFDSTDHTDIATNAVTMSRQSTRGETFWQRFVAIAEIGDATDYYVVGITPTSFQTGTRRLYYRVANTDIEYTARQNDGLIIRDLYGKKVDPWRVRPDRGIRITDQLIGWNGQGDNPAETWIKAITYDANSQVVDYHGDDDRRAEGVFQLKRVAKQTGRHFGATRRIV